MTIGVGLLGVLIPPRRIQRYCITAGRALVSPDSTIYVLLRTHAALPCAYPVVEEGGIPVGRVRNGQLELHDVHVDAWLTRQGADLYLHWTKGWFER